jgi:hypothetical protein
MPYLVRKQKKRNVMAHRVRKLAAPQTQSNTKKRSTPPKVVTLKK